MCRHAYTYLYTGDGDYQRRQHCCRLLDLGRFQTHCITSCTMQYILYTIYTINQLNHKVHVLVPSHSHSLHVQVHSHLLQFLLQFICYRSSHHNTKYIRSCRSIIDCIGVAVLVEMGWSFLSMLSRTLPWCGEFHSLCYHCVPRMPFPCLQSCTHHRLVDAVCGMAHSQLPCRETLPHVAEWAMSGPWQERGQSQPCLPRCTRRILNIEY